MTDAPELKKRDTKIIPFPSGNHGMGDSGMDPAELEELLRYMGFFIKELQEKEEPPRNSKIIPFPFLKKRKIDELPGRED